MSTPIYLDPEKTAEEIIRQRMLAKVPSSLDCSEGSYIWDSIAPAAIELSSAADTARETLKITFASGDSCFGKYLDWRAAEHGVYRKAATKASGVLTVRGSPKAIILAGSGFATPADEQRQQNAVIFFAMERIEIPDTGTVDVKIEAQEAGTLGNVGSGTISIMLNAIQGVSSITNVKATTGGADTENDMDLRGRLLFRVQNPATSGNVAHYRLWATEIPGVGDCSVIPLWAGRGTVKLALIDNNRRPVSDAVLQAAKEYIIGKSGPGSGKAPIGATVTLIKGVERPIKVSLKAVLNQGYTIEQAKKELTEKFSAYMFRIAFAPDSTVRYTRIADDIIDCPSIYDYSDLLLDGGTKNIPIERDHLAVLGDLVVTT